jgi:hypothetical protein
MVKNPMPRMRDPDPNGFLLAMAEQQAANDAEGAVSISSLIQNNENQQQESKKTEEKVGEQVANENEETPGKPPKPMSS